MGDNQPDKQEQVLSALSNVNDMNSGALGEKMGIEFLEATPQRLVARMPVAGNTQPFGLLHGGASVVLAETIGSIGANLHAGEGRIAVGLEINATHHRAAGPGSSPAPRPRCRWAAPWRPTRSSSPTTTATACAPHESPA